MADPSPREHIVSRVFELRQIEKQIAGQLRESIALRELVRTVEGSTVLNVDREIFRTQWIGTAAVGFVYRVMVDGRFDHTFSMKQLPTTLKMPFAKVVARELLASSAVTQGEIHATLAELFCLDLGMLETTFRIHNGEVTAS